MADPAYAPPQPAPHGIPTSTRADRNLDPMRFTIVDHGVRCWRCGRLLIELCARPWRVRCSRCKEPNASPPLMSPDAAEGPAAGS